MKLRLAGLENDSIVDGPGFRLSVFAQGCPHACPGCHNPQSQGFEGGTEVEVESIIQKMDQNPLLDGITLTGGEPFHQASAMAAIGRAARSRGLHVITFTGWTWEELTAPGQPAEWRELLEATDVLVDGPFELALRSLDLNFRGSKNQRVLDVPKSLQANKPVWLEDERWGN